MKQSARPSVARLSELQQLIALLASAQPSGRLVVSCYLNTSQGNAQLEAFVRERAAPQIARLPAQQRNRVEHCINLITARLAADLPPRTRGLAMFVADDKRAPVLIDMPFAVPLRNSLTIAPSPDLLPLIQLKELYGRFMIVLARPEGLQVSEVNLGDVELKLWAANPDQRMAGTDRPTPGRQVTTSSAAMRKQVRLIERSVNQGGACPLFLAGDVDTMQAIRDLLAPSSIARLVGALPIAADHSLSRTAAVCLRALMAFETRRAHGLATRILRDIGHHGLAVSGAEASLDAMRQGIVDTLLVSSDYRPDPAWVAADVDDHMPASGRHTARYGDEREALNLRLELIRLAGRDRIPVEFADDATLDGLGGVACVLRDYPEAVTQTCPPRRGTLDMVA